MVILQMDVLHEYVGKSLVLDSDRTNSIPNVAPMEIYLTQVSQFSRLRRDKNKGFAHIFMQYIHL
jgi:hypothetical protein